MMKKLNNYRNIVIVFTTLFSVYSSYSQQDPQFTQYMYNMSVINPAYATVDSEIATFGILYRMQWAGLKGAPNTGSFFAHVPLSDKIQAGVSFTNDQIGGVINENNIYADFAYILPVGKGANFSLGLKGGVTLFNTDFNGFVLQSGGSSTDIAFDENTSKAFPNIGLGTFYYTDHFYAGLSVPNLLTTVHLEDDNGIKASGVQDIHFFLTSGYVFDISKTLKFKPATMIKGVKGAPLALDFTANFLMNDRFEAGLGYRLGDAASALVGFKITQQLRIGYAYDYTLTNLGDYNSGSHELFLTFDTNIFGFKRGFDRSPRFF